MCQYDYHQRQSVQLERIAFNLIQDEGNPLKGAEVKYQRADAAALGRADVSLYEMKDSGRDRTGGDVGPRDASSR